ncbi:MAG: sterol carrier family protein [Actinobacteria bacterium]|nr:sterol carrier family protein [Actinomycetota bacterium]
MTKVDRALSIENATIALANPTDPEVLATGVRSSLQWFADQNPGRAVEVRVPPYLAVQILGGTTHRRGTPPAVVEMSPQTWLELFTKKLTWVDAVASGKITASGERSDLSELL